LCPRGNFHPKFAAVVPPPLPLSHEVSRLIFGFLQEEYHTSGSFFALTHVFGFDAQADVGFCFSCGTFSMVSSPLIGLEHCRWPDPASAPVRRKMHLLVIQVNEYGLWKTCCFFELLQHCPSVVALCLAVCGRLVVASMQQPARETWCDIVDFMALRGQGGQRIRMEGVLQRRPLLGNGFLPCKLWGVMANPGMSPMPQLRCTDLP
jgi:hypothetical protein